MRTSEENVKEMSRLLDKHPEMYPFLLALVTVCAENPDRPFTEIAKEILPQFGYPAELAIQV